MIQEYRSRYFKLIMILVILGMMVGLDVREVQAQGIESGVANAVMVEGEASEGDVVCVEGGKYVKCDEDYSTGMYGVVVDNPAISVEPLEMGDEVFVMRSGEVSVKTTDANGRVEVGDYVTSSGEAGMVQKATDNGYVLGQVVGVDEGVARVILGIRIESKASSARSNLVSVLRDGVDEALFEPLDYLRYVLAALLMILAFVLGFVYFGRMARTGVEALGRNPMAEKTIRMQVIVNSLVVAVIVGVGLLMAYLVLIL